MSKVAVVYWSGTGNTEQMAESVADGARNAGADVTTFTAAEFDADKMEEFDAIAFGCPSMGAEQLEEDEFEPMFTACEAKLSGKKIALFGSYGWGDGEWMRNWVEQMTGAGAEMIEAEGIIANEAPDADAQAACEAAGKELAANA